LIIQFVGKLKDIGLIPDRQHAFDGTKINFHGAVEAVLISWMAFRTDSF
jgi:hypothetical protein